MFPQNKPKKQAENGFRVGLYGRAKGYTVIEFNCIPDATSASVGGLEEGIKRLLAEKQNQEAAQRRAIATFSLDGDCNLTHFFIGTRSLEVAEAYKQYGVELIEEG